MKAATSLTDASASAASKPVDRWLTIAGVVVGVLIFLLPKTPVFVASLLAACYGLLIHPVWNFWWVERSRTRRVVALVAMAILMIVAGYAAISGSRFPADASGGQRGATAHSVGALYLACELFSSEMASAGQRLHTMAIERGSGLSLFSYGLPQGFDTTQLQGTFRNRCRLVNDTSGPLMQVELKMHLSFRDVTFVSGNGLEAKTVSAVREASLSVPRLEAGAENSWSFYLTHGCATEFADVAWPKVVTASVPSASGIVTLPLNTPEPKISIWPDTTPACPNNVEARSRVPVKTSWPTTVEIKAEPSAIVAGQQTTISWYSYDATRITITPGLGDVTPAGSVGLFPQKTTTYVITGSNSTGATSTKSVVVHVRPR